jgi:hypothetical protein
MTFWPTIGVMAVISFVISICYQYTVDWYRGRTIFWIVRWYHSHGHDVWPVWQRQEPTLDDLRKNKDFATYMGDVNSETEGIEIYGPYKYKVDRNIRASASIG